MFIRVYVHARPNELLSNSDARANVESEFTVSDDEQGMGDAAVRGAQAVDKAIEKLRRAALAKELGVRR